MWCDLLGKEYLEGGRGPDAFDCWGLCLEVSRRAGRPLPAIVTPGNLQATHEAYLAAAYFCRRLDGPQPFCVVAFMILVPFVTHMGIVLPDCRRFIHIMRKRSVAVERLDHPIWSKRVAGYYEFSDHHDRQSV